MSAATFFEDASSGGGGSEVTHFASELGDEGGPGGGFSDAYDVPPPSSFYSMPPSDDTSAAKASAWAAGVPARSASLLSSTQLDALWAAVRAAATVFPTTTAAAEMATAMATAGDSLSPTSSSDADCDPLSCREPTLLPTPPPRDPSLSLSPRGPRRKFLTYAAYRKAAEDAAHGGAGPAAAALLTARAFLRLAGRALVCGSGGKDRERDSDEQEEKEEPFPPPSSAAFAVVVDAESLCDYLGQRAGQLQMHVHLSCFDAGGGSGWLTETGAAAFVRATLPQLARSGCSDAFEGKLSLEDHAAIAARKLVFFHGRNGRSSGGSGGSGKDHQQEDKSSGLSSGKRLRIREVLAGRALAELLELAAPPAAVSNDGGDFDQMQMQQQAADNSPGGPPTNWFSAASAAAAAAAFASGAAAGVEAAAAAGLDLGEARVDFPFVGQGSTSTTAADAANSGTLGIPAAALCELGDGTLSPLFSARLVEERGDARALVAVFPPSASEPSSSSCSGSGSGSAAEDNDEEKSCSNDSEEENDDGKKAEGDGEGDEMMNVDRRRRKRKNQETFPPQQSPPPPPSLSVTAGLSLPSFLDFLLAWSDRNDPKSIAWIWPALDLRGKGMLTRTDVERLFEPVRRLWVERGQYSALRPSDVACEVFDIVVPDRPEFEAAITKKDLTKCSMAGTVIGLLCDVGCFYEHDSRELQLQQAALGTGDEEGEGEDDDDEFEEGRQQQQQQQLLQQREGDLIVLDESKLDTGSSSSMAAAA